MYQFPIMGCKALEETGVEFNSIDTERQMDGDTVYREDGGSHRIATSDQPGYEG